MLALHGCCRKGGVCHESTVQLSDASQTDEPALRSDLSLRHTEVGPDHEDLRSPQKIVSKVRVLS